MGHGLAPAHARPVHQVVVKQGGCVQVLQRGGKRLVVVPAVTAKPGGKHHQKRPQALAAAEQDVAGDVADEFQVGIQVLAKGVFDGIQVFFGGAQDFPFEVAHQISPMRSYSIASVTLIIAKAPGGSVSLDLLVLT